MGCLFLFCTPPSLSLESASSELMFDFILRCSVFSAVIWHVEFGLAYDIYRCSTVWKHFRNCRKKNCEVSFFKWAHSCIGIPPVEIKIFNGNIANFIEYSTYYNCKVSPLFLKLWLIWVARLLRHWTLYSQGVISHSYLE